jgi:hypothetical protein
MNHSSWRMAMADDRTSGRGEPERQFADAQNIELAVDAENLRSIRNSRARVLNYAMTL